MTFQEIDKTINSLPKKFLYRLMPTFVQTYHSEGFTVEEAEAAGSFQTNEWKFFVMGALAGIGYTEKFLS